MFDFKKFKAKVNNLNLVTKTISYSDIDIISMDEILIKNVPFKLYDKNVIRGFLKGLGLNKSVFDSFNSQLKDDSKRLQYLLNNIKKTLVYNEKNTVNVVINEKSLKVVGFKSSKSKNVLSNNGALILLEQTMNNNPGLSIVNGSIDNGGNMMVTTIDKNNQFEIEGMKDEVFKTGLSFINSPIETSVSSFNERLICTNGMTTTSKEMSIHIRNVKNGVVHFVDNVRNYTTGNNFNSKFSDQVKLLSNSVASYRELSRASAILEKLGMNTTEINNNIGHVDFLNEYARKVGSSVSNLDITRQKQVKTHIDKWSLVNILTDISSHTKRFDLNVLDHKALRTQIDAGRLTMETPDILKVAQIF